MGLGDGKPMIVSHGFVEGERIRLVSTTDPHTDLKPGDTGVIALVDDGGTWHIKWDNGSTLGMVPGEDVIELE